MWIIILLQSTGTSPQEELRRSRESLSPYLRECSAKPEASESDDLPAAFQRRAEKCTEGPLFIEHAPAQGSSLPDTGQRLLSRTFPFDHSSEWRGIAMAPGTSGRKAGNSPVLSAFLLEVRRCGGGGEGICQLEWRGGEKSRGWGEDKDIEKQDGGQTRGQSWRWHKG